jgi:hypothetical protein
MENGVVPSKWVTSVLLAAGWASAASADGAQSLAEVAKNERERRAGLAEKAPASVISNEELAASRGESFSVTGSDAPTGEAAATEESLDDETASDRSPTDKEIRNLRERWQGIWRARMDQAERELESAASDRYQCRAATPYFFVPLAIDCDGVEDRVVEAEARLKEVGLTRYRWELLLPPARPSPR